MTFAEKFAAMLLGGMLFVMVTMIIDSIIAHIRRHS